MNRFQHREFIGRGGSAVVYKLDDPLSGETIAIKEFVRDGELPKSELILGRGIRHPNVVQIHELIEDEDGSIYLTMEYVDGGNLRSVMRETGAIPFERWLQYARQILAAVSAGSCQKHHSPRPEARKHPADQ